MILEYPRNDMVLGFQGHRLGFIIERIEEVQWCASAVGAMTLLCLDIQICISEPVESH